MSENKKYLLDLPKLTSVEFPLVVNNSARALEMIGGKEKLRKCIISNDILENRPFLGSGQQNNVHNEATLELRLREDFYHHPINSYAHQNENLLVRVRVPRNAYRKKTRNNIADTLRHCKQNGVSTEFNIIGVLNKNFKFRELADFQYITKNSRFAGKFRQGLSKGYLPNIKDIANGIEDDLYRQQKSNELDLPPPLRFNRVSLPFNYGYKSNPYSSTVVDENGQISLQTRSKRTLLFSTSIDFGEATPLGPPNELLSNLEELRKEVQQMCIDKRNSDEFIRESPAQTLLDTIELLKVAFRVRPIWLRSNLVKLFPERFKSSIKFALPYVSYLMRKGPWRSSPIVFGYDPRLDPSSKVYQIETFRTVERSFTAGADMEHQSSNSIAESQLVPLSFLECNNLTEDEKRFAFIPRDQLFSGDTFPSVVTFQIHALQDPLITSILHAALILERPSERYGWFDRLSLQKVRSIIKYKLDALSQGKEVNSKKVENIVDRVAYNFSTRQGVDEDSLEQLEEEEEENDREECEQISAESNFSGPVFDFVGGLPEKLLQGRQHLLTKLELHNSHELSKVTKLNGITKQEDLMSFDLGPNTTEPTYQQ
ncbi:BA75_03342T0 [Komagataella pastoris]|uniref:BA75_03342T0 n=1 Tax=Komagataella pastoris TaxID=4922 RepID=A0A1B2JGD6_PICPA|nr:BA75_03342T0 [Komagataella pastoris]